MHEIPQQLVYRRTLPGGCEFDALRRGRESDQWVGIRSDIIPCAQAA